MVSHRVKCGFDTSPVKSTIPKRKQNGFAVRTKEATILKRVECQEVQMKKAMYPVVFDRREDAL